METSKYPNGKEITDFLATEDPDNTVSLEPSHIPIKKKWSTMKYLFIPCMIDRIDAVKKQAMDAMFQPGKRVYSFLQENSSQVDKTLREIYKIMETFEPDHFDENQFHSEAECALIVGVEPVSYNIET